MFWTNPIVGWLIFGFWAALIVPSLLTVLVRRLSRTSPADRLSQTWPKVSVIVPARNEAKGIEAGLRSLLSLDYPNLQLLVVNDRSTDETGIVMDSLATTNPNLHVIHITELPEGWLGKSHAMHIAAELAEGELLLFTDGDVIFEPDAIRRAVTYANGRNLDHLSMIPGMIPGGWMEDSMVAFFGLAGVVGSLSWLVPTSFPHAYVGIGAFNLVRRSVYKQVGGHQPIRLDVLDDVKLGKLLKRSGYRQDVLLAGNAVRVRWQDSAWGIVRGLEKNAFAAVDYSITKLSLLTAPAVLLMSIPYIAAIFLRDERAIPHLASIALMHGSYSILGRQLGVGWRIIPLFPIAAIIIVFAFWRSAFLTLRRRGVQWRETFYPLTLLREHLYD